MIVHYKEYQIEIKYDNEYSINSADNISTYDHVYTNNKDVNENNISVQYGINISLNDKIISKAILIGFYGATGIDKSSFIIKNDSILICCSNNVYSLNIPDLACKWVNSFDQITCFNIYEFKNDFLIHGEMEISRIDFRGNRKWSFSAKDIFVTPNGEEEVVKIKENTIEIIDWDLTTFTLDENGKILNQIETKKRIDFSTKKTTFGVI